MYVSEMVTGDCRRRRLVLFCRDGLTDSGTPARPVTLASSFAGRIDMVNQDTVMNPSTWAQVSTSEQASSA